MDALAATRFDGLLSLEIFSDRFRSGSARHVAIDGQRSLLVMLDDLASRTGRPVAGAPALPRRARCRGIEFIEFAMDEATEPRFEAVLSGLGFAKAGIHRSKAVSRWRQGDINIVVNCEKEGFAHSFSITHGISICALALRVEDAAGTVERAARLLDQPFRQRSHPGELDIPAVRGVGGSLVYFVDRKTDLGRLWDIDFTAVPLPAGTDAGLTSFDHLSQTMQYEEMLTWLLFYTSLLDLTKTPVQDVIDPGGVVQSQAVEAADGALRLVLNASQSRQTMAARFIHDFFGSGVQQIALATSDIVRSVRQIRANGIELLPIPENYYDDLAARTDLAEDTIRTFRDHRILYDREGSAEFLHAYTRTLEGGFFFEIVERRGYRGFGAVNAPIRLAAQTGLAQQARLPAA
jgi:4-hydroxyphenylpyruvate dioxygenase